jgi:hypothetical protein
LPRLASVDALVAPIVRVDEATFFDALSFRDAFRPAARTDEPRSRWAFRAPVEEEEPGDGDIPRQASAMPHPSSVPSASATTGERRRSVVTSKRLATRAAALIGMRSDFIWPSFTETQFLRLQSGGPGAAISAGIELFPFWFP